MPAKGHPGIGFSGFTYFKERRLGEASIKFEWDACANSRKGMKLVGFGIR